jgi:hypothetical protein
MTAKSLSFFILFLTFLSSWAVHLSWINGIAYIRGYADEEQKVLERMFGTKVHFCYNPTKMTNDQDVIGFVNDLTQAGTQKLGRLTLEVESLVQHLREALQKRPNERVVLIAHSQGALITYLAVQQLNTTEIEKLEVLAFGGAAALRVTPRTPFKRCINYYSINDPILFVVPSAAQALRSGLVHEEFCFLSPRVGDPIVDHYLLSPTYKTALEWESQRFQREYQSVVVRRLRSFFLLLTAIAEWISSRLQRLFKSVVLRPVLGATRAVQQKIQQSIRQLVKWMLIYVIRPMQLLCNLIRETVQSWKGEKVDHFVDVNKMEAFED